MIIADCTPKVKPTNVGPEAEAWVILAIDTSDGTTCSYDYNDEENAMESWRNWDHEDAYAPIKLFKITYKENE